MQTGSPNFLSVRKYTILTAPCVFAWSLWPVLAISAADLPPIFATSLFFGAGFLFYCIFAILSGAKLTFISDTPPLLLAVGTLGLSGNVAFFNLGIRYSDPVLVNIIAYSWPIFTSVIAYFLGLARLNKLAVLGLVISFIGVAVLFYGQIDPSWIGLCAASFSALCWGTYSAVRKYWAASTGGEMAAFAGVSALLLFVVSALTGDISMPNSSMIMVVFLVGLIPVAIGNTLWDIGMVRGNQVILSALAFATPILATCWLAIWGGSTVSQGVVISLLIVIVGIALTVKNTSDI
ncbi:EamA family transporter [Rhizobium sp. Root483D2]|uniref:DMT family transporter n=1 Tax=Rhizobium sp. Root483D2 TaxID=1736545 RepID=UPI0009E696AD|nr:EamA family transporter [Rhizobium sp. Root483D2]